MSFHDTVNTRQMRLQSSYDVASNYDNIHHTVNPRLLSLMSYNLARIIPV
jgi:hypothetical protein